VGRFFACVGVIFNSFVQWRQPFIGSTAASEVQHMSGSYAVVAPGTNLRLVILGIFELIVALKLVLGSFL
jgi:hypothetical protein